MLRTRLLLPLFTALALVAGAPSASAQSVAGPILALRSARAPRARVRAVQEIARMRPDGGREALEEALRDRSPGVRRAAAITLGELGDPGAIPALNARLGDRDVNVQRAVQASVRALSALPPPARSAQAPGGSSGQAFGLGAAPAAAVAQRAPIDWRRVRVLVTVGNVQNRGSNDPADTAALRDALRGAVEATPDFALYAGSLPAVAQQRIRQRALRWYSLEGSITSLDRQQDTAVHVRAELSLAILSEPGHNIIGTLNTAATAQETLFPGAPDPAPRLARAAIEATARGAIQRMQEQFIGAAGPGARRGRR